MTEKKKIIIYMLMGLCAGLLSFAAVELLNTAGIKNYLTLSILQGAALGLCFGFVFGFADAVVYKELKSGLLKAALACAAGAAIAAVSQIITSQGMLFSTSLFDSDYQNSMNIILPVWRGIGWMLMGAAIGSIDGILKRTLRRVAAGIIGGLAGGFTGGLVYEFFLRLFPENLIIRVAGLVIMGIMIGFFLGEFERRFSYGRLKILNGKLKDREYLLIKRKTIIGPALNNDIYIHGYRAMAEGLLMKDGKEVYFEPLHPEIQEQKIQVTMLNDKPLHERKYLKYQDVLQIGSLKMLYMPS